MRPVALSDDVAVGEVPTADQIAILAKAGFRALLNAQPDGEVARHLSAAEIAKAAAAAGLDYRYVPIENRRPPEDRVLGFAAALAELPRPIYAFCYSGARATAAWVWAAAETRPPGELVQACADAGFDVAGLLPELERRRSKPIVTPIVAPVAETVSGGSVGPTTTAPPLVMPRVATAGGFAVSG